MQIPINSVPIRLLTRWRGRGEKRREPISHFHKVLCQVIGGDKRAIVEMWWCVLWVDRLVNVQACHNPIKNWYNLKTLTCTWNLASQGRSLNIVFLVALRMIDWLSCSRHVQTYLWLQKIASHSPRLLNGFSSSIIHLKLSWRSLPELHPYRSSLILNKTTLDGARLSEPYSVVE